MWGSAALYFAHDYYAGASSLESIHCELGDGCKPASESQLWSYASQLCCALWLYILQDWRLEEPPRFLQAKFWLAPPVLQQSTAL